VSKSAPAGTAPPELPGYQFLQHLGTGGNSQVYLYEQALPKRKVAVKVLNESGLTETARRRFTAEANVTAGLTHRHIVQVFEANVTADGRPYLVMPYYPQPNLSVRARRAHFSVAEVLRIGIQIGSAVETSHRNDVLHRDIKPQNILTDQYGEPALTDFGIATTKGGDGPEGLSVPWSPLEILYGTTAGDERSDVYSLGATLWHLLVGRSPFEQPGGDNAAFALMGRIKSDPPPRTGRTDVPESLERLLRQAMAKDPDARPQTALDLIRGLQTIEQELRLPLTQPILPADISQGPAASPVGPGRHATTPPHDPGTDTWSRTSGGGTTFVRGAAGVGAAPATPDRAAAWAGGAHRVDAWSPGAAEDAETRARGPRRIAPWSEAESRGRHRQLPAEAPEAATMARPGLVRPAGPRPAADRPRADGTGPAGSSQPPWELDHGTAAAPGGRGAHRGRPPRAVVLASGALLVAAAIGGVMAMRHGGGQATPQPSLSQSAPGGSQNALGPGVSAPGKPAITATRAGASAVRFTWIYANHAAGDVFRWNRQGTLGAASGRTTQPELTVSASRGQTVCIEVEVVRADGSEASGFSPLACWPLTSS
jgi:eukaryotic-like serine/threonine-protein kinase